MKKAYIAGLIISLALPGLVYAQYAPTYSNSYQSPYQYQPYQYQQYPYQNSYPNYYNNSYYSNNQYSYNYYYPQPTCTITAVPAPGTYASSYGNRYYGAYGYPMSQYTTMLLSWSSTNATSAYLSFNTASVAPYGSMVVYPQAGQTYTMTVSGPGGTASCSAATYRPYTNANSYAQYPQNYYPPYQNSYQVYPSY